MNRKTVRRRALTEGFAVQGYLLRYHATDLFHPKSRAYAERARLFFEAWSPDGLSEGPVPDRQLRSR